MLPVLPMLATLRVGPGGSAPALALALPAFATWHGFTPVNPNSNSAQYALHFLSYED